MPTEHVLRAKQALPYLVAIGVGIYLWIRADAFDSSMAMGRLGPDAWPKIAIGLLIGAAILGVVQILVNASPSRSIGDQLVGEEEVAQEKPGGLARLGVGIAILTLFPILVPYLGFLVTAPIVIFGQMWVGGYRKPLAAVTIALIGSVVLFFLFQRVVYLSLPIGVVPFSAISTNAMFLLGVR